MQGVGDVHRAAVNVDAFRGGLARGGLGGQRQAQSGATGSEAPGIQHPAGDGKQVAVVPVVGAEGHAAAEGGGAAGKEESPAGIGAVQRQGGPAQPSAGDGQQGVAARVDGGRTGIVVGAVEDQFAAVQRQGHGFRAGAEHVLNRSAISHRAAVGDDQRRGGRGAAATDDLVGGDRPAAGGQPGHLLAVAAKVENARRPAAAQGDGGGDGQGVVDGQFQRAFGNGRAAAVGVRAAEHLHPGAGLGQIQRAAGILNDPAERAAVAIGPDRQRGGAPRHRIHRAAPDQGVEGVTVPVQIQGAIVGHIPADGATGEGIGHPELQRAGGNGGAARIRIRRRQCLRAVFHRHRAAAGDGGNVVTVGVIKGQGGVVPHQAGADGPAGVHLHGSGVDHRSAIVGVGGLDIQGAGAVIGQAAGVDVAAATKRITRGAVNGGPGRGQNAVEDRLVGRPRVVEGGIIAGDKVIGGMSGRIDPVGIGRVIIVPGIGRTIPLPDQIVRVAGHHQIHPRGRDLQVGLFQPQRPVQRQAQIAQSAAHAARPGNQRIGAHAQNTEVDLDRGRPVQVQRPPGQRDGAAAARRGTQIELARAAIHQRQPAIQGERAGGGNVHRAVAGQIAVEIRPGAGRVTGGEDRPGSQGVTAGGRGGNIQQAARSDGDIGRGTERHAGAHHEAAGIDGGGAGVSRIRAEGEGARTAFNQ